MTLRFKVDYEFGGETFWESFRNQISDCPSEALKDLSDCITDSVEIPDSLAGACSAWINSLPGVREGVSQISDGPILIQTVENEPTKDGTETFVIYHKDAAGIPSAHKGGPWFYEPRAGDGPAGVVWSEGYKTKAEALEAALEEENEIVLEESAE